MYNNGVIFQGFHWFFDIDDSEHGGIPLWDFLANEADHFRNIGIDAVWIPPMCKTMNDDCVGYGIYDHFNLGEFSKNGNNNKRTKYGTKESLHKAINSLHGCKEFNGKIERDPSKKYIQVYGDIVMNHKLGGSEDSYWEAIRVDNTNRKNERWDKNAYESGLIEIIGHTKFEYPERNNKYSNFKWYSRHFDGVDTTVKVKQDGKEFEETNKDNKKAKYIYRYLHNEENYYPKDKSWDNFVSKEHKNYDYWGGADLDFDRYDVREEMKYWGKWITENIGLDGFRFDTAKHMSSAYLREWIGHVRHEKNDSSLFGVAEYLDEHSTENLHSFIEEVTCKGEYPQDISVFDFTLREKLRKASHEGESFDLASLNYGTIMAEQPTKAVTICETHDSVWGRKCEAEVQYWFKPLAYAFILLRESGYPCIYFSDYYGSNDKGKHKAEPAGREYLDILLKLRKQFALGEERFKAHKNVCGWVRMGFVDGAKGAMVVVLNNSLSIQHINLNTGRFNKRFYHFTTIKYADKNTPDKYVVAKYKYNVYGDKSEGLYTDSNGNADFLADSGSVSIYIEDGVGID